MTTNPPESVATIVASGASSGALANPEHARDAVLRARQKIAADTLGSVLLFLTAGYAHHPQEAIRAAVKAAGTPEVTGCCALKVFTEEEVLAEVEGAVALVFPHDYGFRPLSVARQFGDQLDWGLTLSSPSAAHIAINSAELKQLGATCSDEFGDGPYSIWQSGSIVEREFCHSVLVPQGGAWIGSASGVKPLSAPMQINRAENHCVYEINQQNPCENLLGQLPVAQHTGLNQAPGILAAVGDNQRLLHVVAVDQENGRVLLSDEVQAGQHLYWARQDSNFAATDLREQLGMAKDQIDGQPRFGLMFSNIARGFQSFDDGQPDLSLFQQHFPDLPLIGLCGHAEISPAAQHGSILNHYSCAFGVFS
ncbi:MAG: FIST N-terminal domain-containing protein [Pseudomonadota bacterium]